MSTPNARSRGDGISSSVKVISIKVVGISLSMDVRLRKNKRTEFVGGNGHCRRSKRRLASTSMDCLHRFPQEQKVMGGLVSGPVGLCYCVVGSFEG